MVSIRLLFTGFGPELGGGGDTDFECIADFGVIRALGKPLRKPEFRYTATLDLNSSADADSIKDGLRMWMPGS